MLPLYSSRSQQPCCINIMWGANTVQMQNNEKIHMQLYQYQVPGTSIAGSEEKEYEYKI